MTLGEKLQHLRMVEGELRGLGRPMTKAEVLRGMRAELGESISHAYMCQLESGARTHMSPASRALLARFFKVLPGYLVSDPADYQGAVVSGWMDEPDALRAWLVARAEDLRDDPFLYHVLLKMSRSTNPRQLFQTLDQLLETSEEPAHAGVSRRAPRASARLRPAATHRLARDPVNAAFDALVRGDRLERDLLELKRSLSAGR